MERYELTTSCVTVQNGTAARGKRYQLGEITAVRRITHQKRLSDDILHYFQIMLHGLVLGVGSLHLFVGEEAEQKRLVLELALLQHF